MQLSKLEDEKRKGNLNLDFLKRNNRKTKGDESELKLDPNMMLVDFKQRKGMMMPASTNG